MTHLRPEEFRAIYARHHDAILRYAWRRVGADDAPDVTAEVFTVAWRRGDQLAGRNALPWLYGVARKVVANHLRAGTAPHTSPATTGAIPRPPWRATSRTR